MTKRVLIPLLLIVFLSGCAFFQTVQEKWDKMTPDEQARVVLSGLQKQLGTKFDEAKAIVDANPAYKPIWKGKVLPAFDKANLTLAKIQGMAMKWPITPEQVYAEFKPDLDKLILYLLELGMKWSWNDIINEAKEVANG